MKTTIHRTAAAAVAAVLLLTIQVFAQVPTTSARSAILLDADSGRVLYEQNADARSLIASTTKIMTGLLVCEQLPMQEIFTVPAEAAGIEGSSMYLKAGEQLTVEALLYGLMLRSGNDAAVALAICCDASVEAFVERMNQRAQELGLTGTHFTNPNGLDDAGHYSTARDLAVLSCHAMKNTLFRKVVSTRQYTVGSRSLTNHNRLLWRYEGANGVKTGYTMAAGRVLVSSACRDGTALIAVTIHDRNDWNDHCKLLDYGFSQYKKTTLLQSGASVGTIAVLGGSAQQVELTVHEPLSWPLAADETAELRLYVVPFVLAPVIPGQAGYAAMTVNGREVCRVNVYYKDPVAKLPEKGFFARIFGG